MSDQSITLVKPFLEQIYLIPVEVRKTLSESILDEDNIALRDESGLPIYEG